MFTRALAAPLIFSLALSNPTAVVADIKDTIIGIGIGAAASELIRGQKKKQKGSTRTSSRGANSGATTLNSQYSRDERRKIQTALNNLGYNVGTVDGSLGQKSRNGISAFQTSRGEVATGQLTRPQFAALVNSISNPAAAYFVDRNLTRQEVVLMQQGLQRLGYYQMRIDGSTGPGTRAARDSFLLSQGYSPTSLTQVQAAVLAASTAGFTVPPYLMQEAQQQQHLRSGQANTLQLDANSALGQVGQAQTGIFGDTSTQHVGFQQTQQQNSLFGAPQAQHLGAPNQSPNPLFGTPQGQTSVTLQPQQPAPLFGAAPNSQPAQAPSTKQQPLFGSPQQTTPTSPQPTTQATNQLFASAPATPGQSGNGAASSLDVFSIGQSATSALATPLAQSNEPNSVTIAAPAGVQNQANNLFAVRATPQSSEATISTSGTGASNGGLDVFAPAGQ